jgi:hypothetical protein
MDIPESGPTIFRGVLLNENWEQVVINFECKVHKNKIKKRLQEHFEQQIQVNHQYEIFRSIVKKS